jgi:hypothetical protein
MQTTKILTLMVLAVWLAAAGCATTDSTVPAATGIGAAGGALLGYGLTGSGLGAAAGAGAGALAGAVTGVVIDESRRASAQPAPQSYQAPPPGPQAYAVDPTRGEFINATGWRLEVYVDNAGNPLHLTSGQSYPISLDIGDHQVVAKAYVSTQYGERLVGTYSRSVIS